MLRVPRPREAEGGPAARLAGGRCSREGRRAAAIVPGKPDESLLVEAVNYEGLEMPPAGKLEPDQIAVLTRWVALGDPLAGGRHHGLDAHRAGEPGCGRRFPGPVQRRRPSLWSFQPLRRAGTAERCRRVQPRPRRALVRLAQEPDRSVRPQGAARQGPDARARGRPADADPPRHVRPHGPAADAGGDRRLPRRPGDRTPTSGWSTACWPRPRYGQRWGRHWLDLVRYAESDGHRQDAYRPDAWRYRDYVVRSFNADKPYDRFLTEQLAGDELDPDDPELRIATGYLRLGTYEFNQRNVRGQWADILNDITDVTGEVFLGPEHRLRPLPRPQVRPDPPEGLLPAPGVLHAPPAARRPDAAHARRVRPITRTGSRRGSKPSAEVRRQIAALEEPYREKAAQGAIAKFPDDIKAILRKAGERSHAAGEPARRLWPTARWRSSTIASRPSRAGRRRDATS